MPSQRVNEIVLVGESNPYGEDPRYAMFPRPENSAGWRLCHLIFRMKEREYLRLFERVNLLSEGNWLVGKARFAAEKIREMYDVEGRTKYVLLGRKVAEAFGFEQEKPLTMLRDRSGLYLLLPHPSGRNLFWNKPFAADQACGALAEFRAWKPHEIDCACETWGDCPKCARRFR